MRFIDLFAGVGGFHLGFERAGIIESEQLQGEELQEGKDSNSLESTKRKQSNFSCVWSNEWNKYAGEVYQKRFPRTKFSGEDIRTVDVDGLPEFDLLCGGFPCQAFSIAGKRKGFDDTRGTLFFEIARIIKARKPKIVLLENVRGLLSHEAGRTFGRIIEVLGDLGYWVEWEVLNSKNFGVPQNRERVFIVGHLRGERGRQIFPLGQSSEEINEQRGRIPQQIASTIFSSQHKIARGMTMIETKAVLTPDREEKRQNGRRFKEDGEPMFTLTGQDIHGVEITSYSPRTNDPKLGGSGPLRNMEHSFTVDRTPHIVNRIRRLTPVECERLQGFPDNWTEGLSDTQRYKCMGNAVTVNVVQAIAEKILLKSKEAK